MAIRREAEQWVTEKEKLDAHSIYVLLKKEFTMKVQQKQATNRQFVLINNFDVFNPSGRMFSYLHANFDHDASTISHTLYL